VNGDDTTAAPPIPAGIPVSDSTGETRSVVRAHLDYHKRLTDKGRFPGAIFSEPDPDHDWSVSK
jgi:hypothetical protein